MTEHAARPIITVIDTSVAVPILEHPTASFHWLVLLWQSEAIKPVINTETITELREKLLERSPTAHPMRARQFVRRALAQYEPWCQLIPLSTPQSSPQCRDVKDQKFIDLAITAGAQYLITRDNDQLAMNEQTTFEIVNDRDFRSVFSAQPRVATKSAD